MTRKEDEQERLNTPSCGWPIDSGTDRAMACGDPAVTAYVCWTHSPGVGTWEYPGNKTVLLLCEAHAPR